MDALATAFDAEPNSEEHRRLLESVPLGGAFVEVQYYLGRLLRRNLFRQSYEEVHRRLVSYMRTITSREGARFLADEGDWSLSAPLLRFRFERDILGSTQRLPREVMAVEEFLTNPSITLTELARKVGTTEKQLCRMTQLNYARALPIRAEARRQGRAALSKTKTNVAKRRRRRS
jgi:hypothetical protein